MTPKEILESEVPQLQARFLEVLAVIDALGDRQPELAAHLAHELAQDTPRFWRILEHARRRTP